MPAEPFSLDEPGLPAERQFYTAGYVSQLLSMPPHEVARLAQDAGMQADLSWNGVPVFSGATLARMIEHLKLAVNYAASLSEAAEQ